MTSRLLVYWLVLCGAGLTASAATPTIKWQLNNPAINPNDKRLVGINTWYEIRADAYDSDGNLTDIRIYKDGQPFAFAGGNDGWHSNWGGYTYEAAAGVHVFEAYAMDGSGGRSPSIYWITKASASGSDPLTFGDLVPNFGVGPDEVQFPNTGNPHANAHNLYEIIESLPATGGGKTLSFKAEDYLFDISHDRRGSDQYSEPSNIDSNGYYNPGRPFSIHNVSNITLKGATDGQSLLRWASYDSNGSVFHQYDAANNVIGFLEVQDSCVNVWVQNLAFDSEYGRRKDTGNHVIVHNQGFYLSNCKFYRATSYAINIGAQSASSVPPAHVHIDSSYIDSTYSDGVHVHAADDIWIVGNAILNTGDDAIAFVNHESSDAAGTRFATNFHVLWNYIVSPAGVGVGGATFKGTATTQSEIVHNYIYGSGSSGIMLYHQLGSGYYTTPLEWIRIQDNQLDSVGTHSTPVNPGSPKAAFEIVHAQNVIGYVSGQTSGWNKVTNCRFIRVKGQVNQGNVLLGLSNDSTNNAGDVNDGSVAIYQQP